MAVETTRKLSYEEFLDFEGEETVWYEWVDGELVVTPAAGRLHQLVAGRLGRELLRLGDDAGHGLTLSQILYRVSATLARVPDFVFIGRDKLPLPREGKDLTVVPDLVVEILSPATAARDLREKRDEYRAAGVPTYWIVDLDVGSVTVWDFAVDPPRATEHRRRLPWVIGGQLLGEINLDALFATEGLLR
ncbi:MAG TPA: Uma2 family endonuclease [Gemmatimonadales bacterium]|nr:Uma2 family endonuclease [Gemmatimonadales bacterium]